MHIGVPRKIVLPTLTIDFLGDDLACPNQSEAYLGMLYGDYNKVEYTYIDEKPAIARAALANLDHE